MSPCNNTKMRRVSPFLLSSLLLTALLMQSASIAASDTVLPEKTRITLQLNNKLSTRVNSEGDAFTAYVTAPVLIGDKIVIPKGSVVTGSISRIIRPGRFKGKAVLNVLFQSIEIPGRGQVPIAASLARMDADGEAGIRSEGTVVGEGSEGNDIGRVVMPGIVGAGVGTLAGGGKGAAIGGGIGAAIGLAAVFATRGKEIEVPRGSTLDITLDKPLAIPPEEAGFTAGNR
ncbi:MAG: hypothetical protein QUT30_16525 [Acidobacteriota bacterium]|nr:hypothetical protein [Acidobacteriota bacterium]